MRSSFVFLLALLSAALAAPQSGLGGILDGIGSIVAPITGALGTVLNSIPVLYAAAPEFLITTDPSPQCANVNEGTLLCCSSTINGDMPIVVELAQLAGNFKLNPNSINGLYCKKGFETCNPGTKLCCQVDDLINPPIVDDVLSLALYCQNAPTQDTTSPA